MTDSKIEGEATDDEDDGEGEDDEAAVHEARADAELRVRGECIGADQGEGDESCEQLQQGDAGNDEARRRRWQWIASR